MIKSPVAINDRSREMLPCVSEADCSQVPLDVKLVTPSSGRKSLPPFFFPKGLAEFPDKDKRPAASLSLPQDAFVDYRGICYSLYELPRST